MEDYIFKANNQSKQLIGENQSNSNGLLEPFVDFDMLLKFYYYNVYHQRCIKLKASLLSQILETSLDKYICENETLKEFLLSFTIDLELYGNAFLEKTGTNTNFTLYNILGYQARLDKDKNIFQLNDDESIKLDGFHLKYYSPTNKYYGEPDYLTQLLNIETVYNADMYNSSFFKNGAKPGMIISYENTIPSQEQIQAAKEFFSSNLKAYENAHKSMILWTGKSSPEEPSAKINFERLDQIEDMSFENLKKVSRDEIITAHGVPPRLVGIVSPGQLGAGNELIDQLHSFIQTTLNPKIDTLEEFFANIGIKYKVKPLDVTNFRDDMGLVTQLVDREIISINEAKEILGLKA